MWNYKRSKKIVEAADAWDVLSSPKFEWLGSFKETLKKAAIQLGYQPTTNLQKSNPLTQMALQKGYSVEPFEQKVPLRLR
jgi:hypothetical protein